MVLANSFVVGILILLCILNDVWKNGALKFGLRGLTLADVRCWLWLICTDY